MTALLVALLLWLAFNLAASYAPLMLAERISPGRLPAELLSYADKTRVRFYVGHNVRSYAFNVWAPPYTAVVFDKQFFLNAGPDLIRFVIAHELGHATYRHHIKRWFSVVTGAALFPGVRRWLARQEGSADDYAERLTGYSKSMFPQLQ